MRRLVVTLCILLPLSLATTVAAFPTQDDQTPGTLALGFEKRGNVWARFDVGVLDGSVTTTPPDSKVVDRRIETFAAVGGEGLFTKRFAGRLNVKAEGVKRRTSGDEDISPVADETTSVLSPSLDLTFITDKGLELFAGVENRFFATASRKEKSQNGTTTTDYGATSVAAPRFGVTRRAGAWAGGFYYVQGEEAERDVKTAVFDGTSNTATDVVFVPGRFGIFGEFNAGLRWDFDLAFVQARGMGPKDENGVTAYADYFEAKVAGLYMLGSGFGLRGGVFHKTLSYANNSFVTLETIPVTSIKGQMLLGDGERNLYAGFVVGRGEDGQSLPEFNAEYDLLGYAVTLGFVTPL